MAKSDGIRSFLKDPEHSYYRAYEMFLKYSDLHKTSCDNLHKYLWTSMQQMQPRCSQNQFNVLSIGSGDGRLDLMILKEVINCLDKNDSQKQAEVVNTAIEPHSYSLQQYKDLIQMKMGLFETVPKRIIKYEFDQKSFDEYVQDKHEKNRYDMIHGMHSIYWVKDPISAVRYCYDNELKDKGLIVLTQGSENNLFTKIFTVACTNKKADEQQTTPKFESLAKKNGYKYEHIKYCYSVDVSKILQEPDSEEGNLLLDFMTFKSSFRLKTDKGVVDKVCQILRENSTEDKDGKILATVEDEMLVVFKL